MTLDEWSGDEIDAMMEVGGNASANSIYEAYIPEGYTKPGPDASHEEREKFIRLDMLTIKSPTLDERWPERMFTNQFCKVELDATQNSKTYKVSVALFYKPDTFFVTIKYTKDIEMKTYILNPLFLFIQLFLLFFCVTLFNHSPLCLVKHLLIYTL